MSLPRARSGGSSTRQRAQAVKQVGTKASVAHRGFEVDVGGGNDSHVHRNRFAPAETFDLAFLQKAQQARLALQWQIANFIEQQGAAICCLYTANLALVGAGKRAPFVAK